MTATERSQPRTYAEVGIPAQLCQCRLRVLGAALSRANAELPCTLRGAADGVAENAVIGPSSPLQSVPASIQEIDAAKDENRRAEAAAWSDFYQVKLVDDDSDL